MSSFVKIVFFSFLLAPLLSKANTWGEQHCLNHGGELAVFTIQNLQIKSVKICSFGFSSQIEVNTLDRSYMNPWGGPQANQVYRQSDYGQFGICERNSGRRIRGRDSQGRFSDFCFFQDRSVIGTRTLEDGIQSGWNRELNRALGIF